MSLDTFLGKVDKITEEAKEELTTRTHRMEVTAIHGKYLGTNGVLQKTLKAFVATSETDGDLSRFAVKEARNTIKSASLERIKDITRLEQQK